jgi:C1A family cysteine protease
VSVDIYEPDDMPALGYLPDRPDSRDLRFDKVPLLKAAPEAASVEHLIYGPLSQGRIGSCVANAVAQAIFVSHMRQLMDGGMTREQALNVVELASRLAIYYLARATHHMEHFDSGTFIRAAIQILNKLGFCAESAWKYDTKRFAEKPPFDAFALAFDQSTGRRPAIYWRIYGDGAECIAQVKGAIANGNGVVFGTEVGVDFAKGNFDPKAVIDPRAGERAGGHAMMLCGYDAEGVRLVNSWGKLWGDEGFAKVSWDFVANGMRDKWIIEHAPPYAEAA